MRLKGSRTIKHCSEFRARFALPPPLSLLWPPTERSGCGRLCRPLSRGLLILSSLPFCWVLKLYSNGLVTQQLAAEPGRFCSNLFSGLGFSYFVLFDLWESNMLTLLFVCCLEISISTIVVVQLVVVFLVHVHLFVNFCCCFC